MGTQFSLPHSFFLWLFHFSLLSESDFYIYAKFKDYNFFYSCKQIKIGLLPRTQMTIQKGFEILFFHITTPISGKSL